MAGPSKLPEGGETLDPKHSGVERHVRLGKWWWFGVVFGLVPIGIDYLLLIGVHFTERFLKGQDVDWWDPIRRGQMILVAVGLYVGIVAEALDSSDPRERVKVVGFGLAFVVIASVTYAVISTVERNHNDRWGVQDCIIATVAIFGIAMYQTWRWARR